MSLAKPVFECPLSHAIGREENVLVELLKPQGENVSGGIKVLVELLLKAQL